METPKIKRVEEEFGKPQLIHSPHYAHAQSWPDKNETITQDRASIRTSLVEAVEKSEPDPNYSGHWKLGYKHAKNDFITIINSIFKE